MKKSHTKSVSSDDATENSEEEDDQDSSNNELLNLPGKNARKKEKKDSKKRVREVNEMIDSVNTSKNKKLNSDCKVDVGGISSSVMEELEKFNEVYSGILCAIFAKINYFRVFLKLKCWSVRLARYNPMFI